MERCSSLIKCSAWKQGLAQNGPPPNVPVPDNVPSEPAFKMETSLEDLNRLLNDVQSALQSERFKPTPPNERWNKRWSDYMNKANTFMQTVDGLQMDITRVAAETSKGLLFPLLNSALAGLGPAHWAAVGFYLVVWSLDAIHTSKRNWNDLFGLLKRIVSLLVRTKEIWEATSKENVEILQDSVEKSFRCAIICSKLIGRSNFYRFFTAPIIKDGIAVLGEDLKRLDQQLTGFAVGEMHAGCPRLPRQLPYPLSDEIVGTGEETGKAVAHLDKDSSDLVAVCLHGMGGIGKSTLALTIFVQFQGKRSVQGEYRLCREELPFEIKSEELPKIQTRILEKVCMRSIPTFSSTLDGREYFKMELQKIKDNPVFLFLDNVLEQSHLTELLPEARFFPAGSRILITTRHESVRRGLLSLKISDFELIEVKKLNKPLAKKLLWMHVLQGKHEPPNAEDNHWKIVEKLETQVLKLCDGLPLALKVAGAYIAGGYQGSRDVKVWENLIEAMQNAENLDGGGKDELRSSLIFSIVNLDKQTRRAFLDVVVFLSKRWRITWKEVERVVTSRHLENLKERALVEKELDIFTKLEIARVHDVLNAMGLKEAAEDEQEIRVTSQDAFDDIKSRNALEKVVALIGVKLEAEELRKMPLLRFLVRVEIGGECPEPVKLKHLTFVEIKSATSRPFDMSPCTTTLKHLSWHDCQVTDPSELEVCST